MTAASTPTEDAPADLAIGAFSDEAPWIVHPEEMRWRDQVPTVRWAVRKRLPELVAPRLLPPGTRVFTVIRHIGVAVAGWVLNGRRRGGSDSKRDLSRRLRVAAERLGPTYIKLGQIISSGEGLFPEELVGEFQKLRDKVPAETFEDVKAVVESELGAPLARRVLVVRTRTARRGLDRPSAPCSAW